MHQDNERATESSQARWARFRFSIIGSLLSSPADKGELKKILEDLSAKSWRHPVTGLPVAFSVSTLERWFYAARKAKDPVHVLRTKRRSDCAISRTLSVELKQAIQTQYREHPQWSVQLHVDNLSALWRKENKTEDIPSYHTIRRYMKSCGLHKKSRPKRLTSGALLAAERLEQREVRSFEMDYVHGLWHLDFHHGSRRILDTSGQWRTPLLLCILDDRSRIVCHAQWYWDETAASLIHGFTQALQKRGLPRALMSDNGAAMSSAEFTQGLERLSILHQPTLPYSPYQNAKQEVFWAQVEGRFMAMLPNEDTLTLSLLNESLIAWVEFEYHRKLHSELNDTPLNRYLQSKHVGRECPATDILRQTFCVQTQRKQRRSDGTVSIEGRRFEVPHHYRHLDTLTVRYARHQLRDIWLVDPQTDQCVERLYPQDKSVNSHGERRAIQKEITQTPASTGFSPLLAELMQEYAATGLPPAYLPKEEHHHE